MRIKPDLYSGRLFECWEPKKRDHQTLRVISHRNMKINAATGVSTRHKVTTMMSGDIVTKTKNIRVGSRSGGWLLRWKKVLGGRIPYSISMKDDSPFVFAGLWEGWKDPANDQWLHTSTIITGEPNELCEDPCLKDDGKLEYVFENDGKPRTPNQSGPVLLVSPGVTTGHRHHFQASERNKSILSEASKLER